KSLIFRSHSSVPCVRVSRLRRPILLLSKTHDPSPTDRSASHPGPPKLARPRPARAAPNNLGTDRRLSSEVRSPIFQSCRSSKKFIQAREPARRDGIDLCATIAVEESGNVCVTKLHLRFGGER